MRVRYVTVPTLLAFAIVVSAEVFLPGTQPEEKDIRISKVGLCKSCHAKTPNGNADPYFSWQGGMMSQAARDPIFRAALVIANQDIPGVGEYCIRCHAPAGWFEGRSKKADGSQLTRHDLHGLSCDVCHRFVDPKSEEAAQFAKDLPPGYGNGMMVLDTRKVARGPYDDSREVKSHKAIKSEFHASGKLCGTCHDVSNPLAAKDIRKQEPHSYGPIERTYSEWLMSDYSSGKDARSCQSCHYPQVEGGGRPTRKSTDRHREYFVEHGPVGGSTWVQLAVNDLWGPEDLDPKALEYGRKKARAFLKTAAKLALSFPAKGKAVLRVTNLTGHKLPTGYPEGRRMWVNVKFLDKDGKTIGEIGKSGLIDDTVNGQAVEAPTLVDPDKTRVYECLPGISDEQAKKHNKKPGKSFHFVLNDYITFDNRIPPKGFTNEKFKERNCEPVGVKYADGQYWDDFAFDLPAGCAKVSARLLYQSMSWEYLKFLAEENKTDFSGKKLMAAWARTGMCPPETIAEVDAEVISNQ